MSKALAVRFFNESVRIEQIVWLASQGEQLSDAAKEAAEDVLNLEIDEINRLFSAGSAHPVDLPEFFQDLGQEVFISELYREGLTGFLVQASTPVPERFHEDGGYSHSGFGYFTTEWFYTEAVDAAFAERLFAWKEEYLAEAKAELEKSK